MAKVTDKDNGAKALLNRARKKGGGPNGRHTLRVGVYGDAAAAEHADYGGQAGKTTGEIAEIAEFGLGNNPERSWLRAYVDENQEDILQKLNKLAEGIARGDLTHEDALTLLGHDVVGQIQQRIASGIQPPKSAAWLAKLASLGHGGKTTPLIVSGQFRQSIASEVL